jgi:hypothetical protein
MADGPMNWHKAIATGLVTVGGYGATLPFPWNVLVGVASPTLASLFVRGSQISDKAGQLAKKIPGKRPPAPPIDDRQEP